MLFVLDNVAQDVWAAIDKVRKSGELSKTRTQTNITFDGIF
jgi:hypothetical protein